MGKIAKDKLRAILVDRATTTNLLHVVHALHTKAELADLILSFPVADVETALFASLKWRFEIECKE